MKKALIAWFGWLLMASSGWASLDIGEQAPDFSAPAAMAGRQYTFSLAQSLAKGPVVLYFFPEAFSVGCSAEAHEFAEATEKFRALGATVVGVSTDNIDTQLKFSAQACQGKFPVASDTSRTVIHSYDAAMMLKPAFANRVSYVIVPGGTIVYSYQSLNPDKHVQNTLTAVREWEQAQKRPHPATPDLEAPDAAAFDATTGSATGPASNNSLATHTARDAAATALNQVIGTGS